MTLFFEGEGGWVEWVGQPVNGTRHPANIEALWSEVDLEEAGLFLPVEPPVPPGKVVTHRYVDRVDGVVTWVYTLENTPLEGRLEGVELERERRIALPLVVSLSVGPVEINMDAPSHRNIQGLATVGMYLLSSSQSTTTSFRDFANNEHELTPTDLVSMGLQVAARIQAVYQASWALKAIDPIPADYLDDGYWP